MSEVENKVTLKDFLLVIHKTLSDFLEKGEMENYSELKLEGLSHLDGSIQILLDLAYQKKDIELGAIIEDLEYAKNHLGFVNFKAKSALEDAKTGIDNYK